MQLEVDRALEDGATAAKEAAARLAAADAEIASLREEVSSHQAEMTSIRAALSSLQEERAKEAGGSSSSGRGGVGMMSELTTNILMGV